MSKLSWAIVLVGCMADKTYREVHGLKSGGQAVITMIVLFIFITRSSKLKIKPVVKKD